ncbi:T9SS type A sorting domain-containing protein [Flavobacterium aquidurense]|uniref:Internalin-related protein n=1 Tax=Flavobacterium aquidurense TaxID=362413 RepID=A0A0N8VMR9_9FLAO|nr:T9SS type A sorting domain-containing protein [Flavobacterium aquidurense]KQB40092.1 Internalin-related protein [Flavobacterium aquidurense]
MKKLYFLIPFFFIFNGYSQNAADRDPSFNSEFKVPLGNYYVREEVFKSRIQRDGKIILLKSAPNSDEPVLIRLDNNILDKSFNLGTGFNNSVRDFEIQSDGKIIVSGYFTTYNKENVKSIVRLNIDGSLDKSFTLSSLVTINGGSDTRSNIELQPDGKIVATGVYGSQKGIIRLNSDGSLDTTFKADVNFFIDSSRFCLQPDGKIIATGEALSDTGKAYRKIVRLNANGSLDVDITPKIPEIYTHYNIASQPDGKILITANLKDENNIYTNRIIRLNNDCSLDTTFKSDKFIVYGSPSITKIVVQPDGKIIMSGFFTYESLKQRYITRLNSDGTQDTTFKIGTGANYIVQDFALFDSGKILVGGSFDLFNGLTVGKVLVLNSDGTKDSTFNNQFVGFDSGNVSVVTVLPNEKIMVSGKFYAYNGISNPGFIRLNNDGTQDQSLTFGGLKSFASSSSPFDNISSIVAQTDGKFVIGGEFTVYNSITTNRIVRLNYDGTRDNSFVIGAGFNSRVEKLILLPDGKVVVGGTFTSYKGVSCPGLVRLNSDGSLDSTFKSSWIGTSEGQIIFINDIYSLPDGKILVAGYFKNNVSFVRLNSDGSKDNTFVFNTPIAQYSQNFVVQKDNKFLVTLWNGSPSILRLNPDGSPDNTFKYVVTPATADYGLSIAGIQLDDKVLISGYKINSSDVIFFRLNLDGSLDDTFNFIYSKNSNYDEQNPKVVSQSDGKLLYYGGFTKYKGIPIGGLTRLLGQDYKFVQGQNRLDLDKNGCDLNDVPFKNLKMNIQSGTSTSSLITNTTGNYTMTFLKGTHTITPVLENPSYFNISPASYTVDFPAEASPRISDFCITANGVHADLEVSILPLTVARPGFDAKYKIVYSNKGNQPLSGTISLNFDDTITDFIESYPAVSSQLVNNLKWNFTNLNPTETKEITFVLNVNSPMENPPVNGGAILKYLAEISSSQTDETPANNKFVFDQVVVNSFDPNDKTCIEGDKISKTKIGDYVHYIIRFENTGTYAAQNITVKDVIDLTKYDINSLYPLSGSHLFSTEITDNNKVDFKFENINLPFDDANNDGYLAFKIKTKSTLVEGDSFGGSANIFFDYNSAITTNVPTTTIEQALGVKDFSFGQYFVVYPNPVNDVLNITTKEDIQLSSIQIYNVLGQLIRVIPNAKNVENIDVSGLNSGNYFIKIVSDKGNSSTKFIKK